MNEFIVNVQDVVDYRDKIKLVNPDELVLLEKKEEEVLNCGIILMALSTQKYNQPGILPKWKVLLTGSNVGKETGIKPDDTVIVIPNSGRLRTFGEIMVRYVHHAEILAKVQYEKKDFAEMIGIQMAKNAKKSDDRKWVTL